MLRILFLTYVCIWLTNVAEAQAPSPSFTASVTSGCSPLVVRFTDQTGGQPTAWVWDFGNGASSTLQHPSTTYFQPGTYTVTLKVTNANGSTTLTQPNYITVFDKPEVSFAASDSVGCFPLSVQFTDLSKASAGTTDTAWTWDLGDGTQSNEQNPQRTYLYSGSYSISLKVTNDKGCWSTATKLAYIKIPGGAKADFTAQKSTSCSLPITVNFKNASTGTGALRYTWDFGDGATATDINPSHTYTQQGVYTVTLITENSNGCSDTMRKENLLTLRNTNSDFSAPDPVCTNSNITFTNTSSDSALKVRWDFGDGTTSAAVSPVKSFASPGTYAVKLVQNFSACTDSATKTIQVLPNATAAFTAAKTGSCQAPLTVSFQNKSSNAVSYYWDFGDGTTATDVSPTHTYTGYGNYTVTLLASNAAGCTDSVRMQDYIKVAKPSISFNGLPAKGCAPFTHTFSATINSSDPVVSYLWDFGQGTTSTEASPTFTYTEQGIYTVSLTVTTAGGCKETYSLAEALTLGQKPVVNFSRVPDEFCAFQEVFFSTYASDPTSWNWDFGDGGHSTNPNPLYQYNDTGTFTVHVIVERQGCADTLLFPQQIRIKPPIARFSYTTDCNYKPLCRFKDESLGATYWQWKFGDGGISYEQNPVHIYPKDGTYTVQLLAGTSSCFHITTKVVHVTSSVKPDFTISPASVCKGGTVSFAANLSDSAYIIGYAWDYGNGSPIDSGSTASTVYTKSGQYTVSMIITDINGCVDTVAKPNAVKINGPTATFRMANVVNCRGSNVTLTDASTNDGQSKIVRWQWDLDDGTVVDNTTPSPVRHLYSTIDSFSIHLQVTDTAGCTDRTSLPLLVKKEGIIADFVAADTITCPGSNISFSNLSKVPSSYTSRWNFGDGSGAVDQNPVMAYKTDGVYTVKLTINDGNGCTDSLSRNAYITVKSPQASFSVSNAASSCVPFKVQYTNTSKNYIQQVWDLNGGTSMAPNPTQYYTEPGVYKTTLVVTSPGGCTDTATKNITVYNSADAKLAYLPLNGCKPLHIDLQAHSPQKMSYVWDYGDGTIENSDDTLSRHIYLSFGDFIPKVIMRDTAGCVIPVTGSDTIRIKGATAKFGMDRQLMCDSGMVQFIDSTTFNNPITSYTWNFGDGATSSATSPSHLFAQPGSYNVSLSVVTQNKCVDTFRFYPIKVVASPSIVIGGDSVVCAGEGMAHLGLYSRPDTSMMKWAWQFPNGRSSALQMPPRQVYRTAGNFTVRAMATNSSGCQTMVTRDILVNPLPSVTLPSVITTKQASAVLIPAVYSDVMQSYQWNLPEGLSCTTCPQPMAAPKLNTKYNVTFVDRNGCRNTGEVQVIVLCNNDNVFVPNTFSPNGDGSNDVFYVRGKGLSRVKTLRIFNRWGQVVFERTNFSVNDPSMGWNGTFKGVKSEPGVYVYQVEIFCDNSQVITFDGNVALIR